MENWDEVRTAYQVARLGTVSGAAEVLGVHHATVIRHIDALEDRLGVKLFQRHARGYTPTEAGEDLKRVAQTTDDQLQQLVGRIRGRGSDVSGDLVVTSLGGFSDTMVPILHSFQEAYPDVIVRYLTDDRVFRLEYGEAHVAIRAGGKPQELDNVVQPLRSVEIGMFASRDYVDRHGVPAGPEDYSKHHFIGADDKEARPPFQRWLKVHVPWDRVTFRSSDARSLETAVRLGAGLGFLPAAAGRRDDALVEVMSPKPEWAVPLWLVTHVDQHRTAKVQAFLTHIKGYVGSDSD